MPVPKLRMLVDPAQATRPPMIALFVIHMSVSGNNCEVGDRKKWFMSQRMLERTVLCTTVAMLVQRIVKPTTHNVYENKNHVGSSRQ